MRVTVLRDLRRRVAKAATLRLQRRVDLTMRAVGVDITLRAIGFDVAQCAVGIDVAQCAIGIDVTLCAIGVDVAQCAVRVDLTLCACARFRARSASARRSLMHHRVRKRSGKRASQRSLISWIWMGSLPSLM